jgi:hypothetical protein
MKFINFASVLFIAAALGLWACQQPAAGDKFASVLQHSVGKAITR